MSKQLKHNRDIKKLVSQMTLEEKANMCSGIDFWHLGSVDRLGVPSVMVSDGPHGLRKQDEEADHLGINDSIKAVCFPPACLSACSFDKDLMEKYGETVGDEAMANDLSVVLGPAVNIKRSPLCGRNFEYYSEDPFLSGEVATAFIKGVQSKNVGTSIKHFAANSQEYYRMSCSSDADERTLREIYFPSFEKAVKEAKPYTVMCSYNRINGTYASENKWLLTDVLRKEWGFDGYVMSDWGAVSDRVKGIKAGLDLEMPSCNGINDKKIVEAVKNGDLDEKILDKTVERILDVVFRYYDNRKKQEFTLEADHNEARHIAEESMVLLKNEENILPLKKDEKVAFIGAYAKKPRFQGGGSSHINSFKVDNAFDTASEIATETIRYAKGFAGDKDVYDENLAKEAIDLAKTVDKVVIFAGLPDSFESEGYDRTHMRMPKAQNRLIKEIAEVSKKVVVVLHNGSPVEMPWNNDVSGILEAYLGGQAGGSAVAKILYGEVNPSGKLAETMPIKLSDNPSYLNFGGVSHVNYQEGVFVGYRYYDSKDAEVLYPFGHGLSYTSFEYSNMKLDKDKISENDKLIVSVDVKNTGKVFGKEIVQVYVSDLTKQVVRPIHELKGFAKVALEPGETKTVKIELDFRSFAWYNEEIHDWYAASGKYEIQVAASSRNIKEVAVVEFDAQKELPIKVDINTTVGELLLNKKTKKYGKDLLKALDAFFGGHQDTEEKPDAADEYETDEAVSMEMDKAMGLSMPLRNLITFGIYSEKELTEKIEEIKKAV
ncbi:beta-glucosidase [Lachnospiraceae bacterium C7]|nr:beta-glucosidase [Lachnospiraceae bacterium C7]